jgi:hypothetical protein
VTVTIPVGASNSPYTGGVVAGGVALDPQTAG